MFWISSSSFPVWMSSQAQPHPVDPWQQLGPEHPSRTLSQMGLSAMKTAIVKTGVGGGGAPSVILNICQQLSEN